MPCKALTGRSVCIVGAGVVGLATARAAALAGADVVVVDRAGTPGSGTSARNSQVVHGGMYYPQGSMKAACCVHGRRAMYQFCEDRGVEFRKRGKLIVATNDEQVAVLERIQASSEANGLTEAAGDALRLISGDAAREMEPELRCIKALHSPETGVVDGHGFMLALMGDAEKNGAAFAFQTIVERITRAPDDKLQVHTSDGGSLSFDAVVNCAGLSAINLAQNSQGSDPSKWLPGPRFAKGNYFKLQGVPTPFETLIYPVPEEAGLGVHVTIDIAGQARFGPDVEWIDVEDPNAIDYTVDASRGDSFYEAIRKYWPALPDDSLVADYSGVRPKVDTPGFQDFLLLGHESHGIEGMLHAVGIESPGLTSSMALGEMIVAKLVSE
mmetsp:Transcript_12272/g.22781  ORF Transcript_12272/g.22781 Transcript_12272/m.22781 type:complete len:383 (+) Transcript_12272:78-1226(+)